ncbi:MAG: hypothetical protein JXA11_05320 [Phycisphaerae bacterium]|nr:hypothetical protein [Phycisphaerae bacterium]
MSNLAIAAEWTPTLDNTPNLHTTTLTLTIKAKPGAAEKIPVELHNLAESVWTAEVPAGTTTLTAKDFTCTKEGRVNDGLVFGYIMKITAPEKDVESIEAKWSGDDGVRYPWEVDPAPLGQASDGATIWPGLHRENAGHFALRYEPNGTLMDSVSFDGISRSHHYLSAVDGEFWQFHFVLPDKVGTVRTVSRKKNENVHMSGLSSQMNVQGESSEYNPKDAKADWTSFRWTRKVRVKSGKIYTKELRYGAMGLGVQVETDSPKLAVGYGPAGKGHGNLFLVMPTTEGLQIVKPGEPLNPLKMNQNWLLMVDSDPVGSIPVMLIFQHKPDALEYKETGLTITREKGVGTLAVGAPFGASVLAPEKVRKWSRAAGEIPKAKLLKFRPHLMAYPWGCTETFSVKDNQVHIGDTMTFLPWQDDWGTKCEPASPIPPMVALSVERNYLPKTSVTDVKKTGIKTRFGPYWVREGDKVDYTLPVPRAWDNFSIRTRPPAELEWLEKITLNTLAGVGSLKPDQPSQPKVWTHDWTYDFSAGAWRAANYLTPEQRAKMRTGTRERILGGLLPQNFRLRIDPITGAKYMGVSFVWYGKQGPWGTFELGPNGYGYVDQPFWLGINLYGIYTQAKYNAAWDLIRENWPVVRSLLSYYEFYNSWTFMDPGAQECGGYYHADMPTAGYAGLVGYYYLAKQLGTEYQKDLGAYLLARSAVPMGCKLGFLSYMEQIGMRHCELVDKALPSGFGEEFVASLHRPVAGEDNWSSSDPWWETGCIGPQSGQPEVMDLFVERCFDDFGNFERIFLECCPNEIFAKNNDVRIIPHVMARTRLGGDMLQSGAELVKLQNRPAYLLRDVQAFTEILSAECPIRLIDWTPGYIEEASWDAKVGSAKIVVDGGEKGCTLEFTSKASPVRVLLDDKAVEIPDGDQGDTMKVTIPSGKHMVRLEVPSSESSHPSGMENKR